MILKVKAASDLKGELILPASKSYTIRAFIIASRGGTSRIINPSNSDDAKAAIAVARQLGARVTYLPKSRTRQLFTVSASQKNLKFNDFNVKESGTVLRFLLPLVSLKDRPVRIDGEGTLRTRPNAHLTQALRAMGADIFGQGEKECVPIQVRGGRLRAGKVSVDGSLSSQFVSALLIACPSLLEDTQLILTGKDIVSQTYITMTREILKKSGVIIKKTGPRRFYIKGGQKFKGLKDFVVPSDLGLAAFFLAAAALVKSHMTLRGAWNEKLIQADGKILSFASAMGVRYQKTNRFIKIKGPAVLKGGTFSLKDCPDLVPVMAVLSLFAKGRTRLLHIGHARYKESNRVSDLREELLKIGARVEEKENELIIDPRTDYKKNVLLDPHHDHRLAMAFCILGAKLGARIKDMECTSKSYPGFIKDFKAMGASVANI